jgi:hypothetical protein
MKYSDSRDALTADILAVIGKHGGEIELDEDGHPIISLRVTDTRGATFDGFMYLDEIIPEDLEREQERTRFDHGAEEEM